MNSGIVDLEHFLKQVNMNEYLGDQGGAEDVHKSLVNKGYGNMSKR
jgi:hypothetical protein